MAARYVHRVSGARVEVRDEKVMDSTLWRAEKKAPAKKAAANKKSDDE